MKTSHLLALVTLLCTAPYAVASELSPEQQSFYSSFVSASKANDLKAIRNLSHPKLRECITDKTNNYHERLEKKSMFQFSAMTDKADVTLDTNIEADITAVKPMNYGTKHEIKWPILPETRIFAIQREEGKPPQFGTLYISNSPEGWRRVYPCQVLSN